MVFPTFVLPFSSDESNRLHRKFFKTCEHYYFAIFLWLVRSLKNFSIEGKVVHIDSLSQW